MKLLDVDAHVAAVDPVVCLLVRSSTVVPKYEPGAFELKGDDRRGRFPGGELDIERGVRALLCGREQTDPGALSDRGDGPEVASGPFRS
ncbi:MAG TPA: hypothetical protein VFF17_10595 [Thermoanaerobaculia bacterium]|nr:hypothetical protein [Thermoanaerobaculia bacterium]